MKKANTIFCRFIKDHHLPLIKASGVNDFSFTALLSKLRPHVVLVGSWGEIFKPHVLDIPDILFVNCHPSLLPLHKGPNPFYAAIRTGQEQSGITFHVMDKGIDTGPILLQAALKLSPDETGESLRQRCADLACRSIAPLLEQLKGQGVVPKPQPHNGSYDKAPDADSGWIDWSLPPEEIVRKIRGLYPWFRSFTLLGNHLLGFRFGKLSPSESSEKLQPGSITQIYSDNITVTTTDPTTNLILQAPCFMELPRWLNPVANRLLVKPGKQLHTPKVVLQD